MKRVCALPLSKWSLIVAIVIFSCRSFGAADDSFSQLVGSAYSVETGALLYRETHQQVSKDTYKVEYSEPNGRVFADKTIDFSKSRITPTFSQLNKRNGEKIDVTRRGDQLQIRYRENSNAKIEKNVLKLAPGMVVDAGFDAFVKQYWGSLISGKEMDIEYLVPSRQSTFSFRFSQITCVDGTKEGAMCFALKPVSWFVRMAVDPIVVAYDPSNKRLLRFTGRANICDEQGKYQTVDIQYHYI
ncbi:hypothetical protein [Marinomonas rhizomae]|uniref:DUF3108 domain-containing protein n=1 Tax=Marinomonas rhizomae TaxID=491948 RepID=A0A366IY17_9GAMM|nr:hypothetical protein [Marinomonas rhizomae]RBP79467.1 hypothetical protein DFP80_11456 [Marinomonas rhizomae]